MITAEEIGSVRRAIIANNSAWNIGLKSGSQCEKGLFNDVEEMSTPTFAD